MENLEEKPKLKFDEYSLEFIKTAQQTKLNIFLTAVAGAWKSTIVNYFVANTNKKVALLWTTWISALNIWWKTIHSYFAISPNPKKPKALKKTQIDLIKKIDVFIVDEVSMMRADLFDILNHKMQRICENDELFGWKQFIFVWDLLQLPPVPEKKDSEQEKIYNENYNWLFFFEAKSFDITKFKIIQLQKVYRQDDPILIKALNLIRDWVKSQSVIDYFNKRVVKENEIDPHSIMLTALNRDADNYNNKKLAELEWEVINAVWMCKWIYQDLENDELPHDKFLKFKVWARVMFIVNENTWWTYMNWTLWTITWFFNNWIEVDIDWLWKQLIPRYTWTETDWEDEFWEPLIVWQYFQYPFKLAFAISIHKSQWKSFDKCVINLWYLAFAEGMTYVALSRCKSYEWLQLIRALTIKDIKVSMKVLKFLKDNLSITD